MRNQFYVTVVHLKLFVSINQIKNCLLTKKRYTIYMAVPL